MCPDAARSLCSCEVCVFKKVLFLELQSNVRLPNMELHEQHGQI